MIAQTTHREPQTAVAAVVAEQIVDEGAEGLVVELGDKREAKVRDWRTTNIQS